MAFNMNKKGAYQQTPKSCFVPADIILSTPGLRSNLDTVSEYTGDTGHSCIFILSKMNFQAFLFSETVPIFIKIQKIQPLHVSVSYLGYISKVPSPTLVNYFCENNLTFTCTREKECVPPKFKKMQVFSPLPLTQGSRSVAVLARVVRSRARALQVGSNGGAACVDRYSPTNLLEGGKEGGGGAVVAFMLPQPIPIKVVNNKRTTMKRFKM